MTRPSFFFLSGDRALVPHRTGPLAETLLGLAEGSSGALEITAVAPGGGPAFDLAPDVRVLPLGKARWRRARQAREALAEVLAAGKRPFVVQHLHGLDLASRGAWRHRTRVRGWLTEVHHLSGVPRSYGWRGRVEARAVAARVRFLAHHVTAFRVVEPRFAAPRLRELGVPEECVYCVPAVYLDAAYFAPDEGTPRDIDVLWISPWTVEKGRALFVRAIEQLRVGAPAGSPLRVAAIGRGCARGLASRRTPNFCWEIAEHVEREELRRFYRRARVLAITSSAEGGPRVAAEALACGTPVVATDVGRCREWIDGPHVGGIADATPPSFARAIEAAWADALRGNALRETVFPRLAACERALALRAYRDFLLELWERGEARCSPS